MAFLRLDKYLSDMGIASRKELKQLIRSGRVSVDGKSVLLPETKIDCGSIVSVDGRILKYSKYHYYMMDKPCGILTATEDGRQKTVLDLVTDEMRRMGLFPVGRLDKDTSGVLLLTDDGEFAHRVISPKSSVEKLYYAKVDGIPDAEDVNAFEKGLILGDGTHCLPAKLTLQGDNTCYVTVMEGKYHQVRRMLASRGKPVLELRRMSIGRLKIDDALGPGGFRELEQWEIDAVFLSN
ncbi:MAG: pseudouridine synthase [Eubacteriales bacterium]|nr:pseudouridine synthase [Eubacteriales bacterium]